MIFTSLKCHVCRWTFRTFVGSWQWVTETCSACETTTRVEAQNQ